MMPDLWKIVVERRFLEKDLPIGLPRPLRIELEMLDRLDLREHNLETVG